MSSKIAPTHRTTAVSDQGKTPQGFGLPDTLAAVSDREGGRPRYKGRTANWIVERSGLSGAMGWQLWTKGRKDDVWQVEQGERDKEDVREPKTEPRAG